MEEQRNGGFQGGDLKVAFINCDLKHTHLDCGTRVCASISEAMVLSQEKMYW